MAHFAQLDLDNIVKQVVCVENSVMEDQQGNRIEELGIAFLQGLYGTDTIWAQTSYNTRGGIYYVAGTNDVSTDQAKAFRKNYAGVDFTYDAVRDAFIPPQPYPSWVLNETTCLWEAPVAMPADGKLYRWDEATASWIVEVAVGQT